MHLVTVGSLFTSSAVDGFNPKNIILGRFLSQNLHRVYLYVLHFEKSAP
jgi:hypothetical protein